ncbi:MAG: metalloregulator ArsR/SmtB family transcription factor, partial [Erythrobacter sp.]|nr:metalloregulator ArsR/SmtB family transcription factor [Erythrobacter sp.]
MSNAKPLFAVDPTSACQEWPGQAAMLKAIGDPLRLQILRVLSDDSFSVSELCDVFSLRQSALSHHLKVLVNADWLARRREGTVIYYRRQHPQGGDAQLREAVFTQVDAMSLPKAVVTERNAVQRRREHNSIAFFENHSDQLREQQDLMASWSDYADATLQLLDSLSLTPDATILEIGPGDGALLPALC